MSTLGDIIAAGLSPVMVEVWGDSIDYTPAGGSVNSGISAMSAELPDEDFHRKRRYTIQTSDQATSARGDAITDGSDTWIVWRQEDAIGGLRHLECKLGATITYETAEGVSTSDVPVIRETLPDLSPATQGPLEQRLYFVASADLASAPDRIDEINDGGQLFQVFNFELGVDGMVKLYTKILQVRG